MTRYGTVGYDVGSAGRWSRFAYGLLIVVGAAASTVTRIGETGDPVRFLLEAALAIAGITGAPVAVDGLLGERVFARVDPWVNTLILVGPALMVAYWNLTLGHALGVDLPTPLTLAMLAYIGISLLIETFIRYGGCEVVSLPILVFRRRYVTYCVPIVVVDATERGWLESDGLRRGLWIALGAAALLTILLGMFGVQPIVTGPAFLGVVALVAALTYIERGRGAPRQDAQEASPAAIR